MPVLAYGAPAFGVLAATALLYAYFVKYATDVLLVPAGVMGTLYLINRLWDAGTDPLVGFWSDRTRSRWGRRRPWLVASVVPLVVFSAMAWTPPGALEGTALAVWVGVALLGFSTATTLFLVPHNALGAELTTDYHERTRVFASREYFAVAGSALALGGGVAVLTRADDPRGAALWIVVALGVVIAGSMAWSVPRLRERAEHQGRGAPRPIGALRDTFANPHARTIYAMVWILHMGGGASSVLSPYIMDDVIGAREHTATVYIVHMVSQFASIPVWTRLAKAAGKKATWLTAMGVGMVGYAMILFVGEGDLVWMCTASGFTGSLHAAGIVIGYSVLADVVDWDELRTGERKEASYFAVYHFLYKAAGGVMAMLAGYGIQWAGYDGAPDVLEQTPLVKRTMTTMLGGIPLACIGVGALLFSRFRLTSEEHARIRGELEARRAAE